MKIHLVHAHPEPQSFVASMRDTMIEGFKERGDEVTVSDLYAMSFNPVAGPGDFLSRSDPQYLTYSLEQRAAWASAREQAAGAGLAPDILLEVERVMAADLLVFSFPVFWFGLPAILKGWVDRVFLSGPFYGGKRIYAQGGLAGKRAFAAYALGGREHMFGERGIHGELTSGMLRGFFQGSLGYVGLRVYEPFIAFHVPYIDDSARKELLRSLKAAVLELEARPVLPVPDLARFDSIFAPLDQ